MHKNVQPKNLLQSQHQSIITQVKNRKLSAPEEGLFCSLPIIVLGLIAKKPPSKHIMITAFFFLRVLIP